MLLCLILSGRCGLRYLAPVRMSRPALLTIRLARLVAGEAAFCAGEGDSTGEEAGRIAAGR
jgi:hypothetical protein